MRYRHVVPATFLERPNRFIARVRIGDAVETVHVKNTGRCRELLIPDAEVYLAESENPARKTKYDLIAVRKENGLLVNIDSQAPNQVAREWLEGMRFGRVVPEFRYGESRIDFYMERGTDRFLMEVKGCTLEVDGIGYFPDAPTEQGVKHLRELARAAHDGFHAMLAFVIQVDGVKEVRPNIETHPEFGLAMEEAKAAGVEILFLPCHVEPDSLEISFFQDNHLTERRDGIVSVLQCGRGDSGKL